MARLYANENFPLPVVEALRRLGHDVLTIQETGKAGEAVPDQVVLDYAVAEERTLLTLNRKHFIRLHNARSGHNGIILCTFDANAAGQASRIHAAIEAAGDLRGQLLRVNRPPR